MFLGEAYSINASGKLFSAVGLWISFCLCFPQVKKQQLSEGCFASVLVFLRA